MTSIFKNVFLITVLAIISTSCNLDRNKPNVKQLKSDYECVSYFEGIAKNFLKDSIKNYTITKEQFITADKNHKLLKKSEVSEDPFCDYRGLRDYNEVTVVEINSWKFFAERYSNLQICERHLLLVGEWSGFDVNQLLWRKNEKIVHEEVIGNNSKLIVTQISWYVGT